MEATEAITFAAPGLDLGSPLKVSHQLYDFQYKNGLARSKTKFQA